MRSLVSRENRSRPSPSVADAERCVQIGDKVAGVFDSDRQAQQIGGSGAVGPFDRGAVLDQAFDAAERGRPLPNLDPRRRDDRRFGAPFYAHAHHAAEAADHLARRDSVTGMPGQPRIEHRDHAGMSQHRLGDLQRRAAGPLDTRIEGAHAAQQKIGFEAAEDRAAAAARRDEVGPKRVLTRGRQRAGDHIAVAVQVFGRRVHDEIGAECQWPGQHRRGCGAVDGEQRAGGMGDLDSPGDVGHRPQRVCRGLDPQEASPSGADRPAQRIERGRIDERGLEPPGIRKGLQPAAQAPIHDLRSHDKSLRRDAHVVAPQVTYWGLRSWLKNFADAWGLEATFVDATSLDALRRAVRPGRTRLLWIETPANPLWSVTDIAGAVEIAHAAGALLAVDSTAATPVLTRPLALGADLVMHSATKYLNGHSDVIAGTLTTARQDAFWADLVAARSGSGAILGGFEAYLLLRGMRTLYPRVERACRSALQIAEAMLAHPRVIAVLYPGLPGHPGHAVAARQMIGGFGGMMSVRVKGGAEAAIVAAARVEVWKRATSLGGVESLIEHRASIEGADSPAPPDLLRLSVGIEDPGDLVADLNAALSIGD